MCDTFMLTHCSLISEHFCWFVFRTLVDALITCQTGYCSEVCGNKLDAGTRKDGWRRILHLNLTAENVFLAGPDSKYAFYKQPVLADFETAVCLSENANKRQEQFKEVRWAGTKYWQAPEQCQQYSKARDYVPGKWELDHATDVYSLGLLIRHMMMCTRVTPEKSIDEHLQKLEAQGFAKEALGLPNQAEYEFNPASYPPHYSKELVKAVQGCLAFRARHDPMKPGKKHRLSLFQLRDMINDNLNKLDAEHGEKIEAAQNNSKHPLRVLFTKEDPNLKIGATFAPTRNTTLEDLIVRTVAEEEKVDARKSWEAHIDSVTVGDGSNMPETSTRATEHILDQVIAESRDRINAITGITPAVRETYFYALQHATSTIGKCINPKGMSACLSQLSH